MNKKTDADQCLDVYFRDEFTKAAQKHSFFAEEGEEVAFTDKIMEHIHKAEASQEAAQENSETIMPLPAKEPKDIVTPLYCSASENQNLTKEKKPMKSKKVLVAAVAAALCLTSATCFALGKIASYESHSYRAGESFPTVTKLEQVLNTRPDVVENFSNGFKFTRYSVGETATKDENGAKLEALPQLSLDYRNEKNQWIALSISGVFAGQDFGTISGTITLDNGEAVDYYYGKDHYKFVPVSYEVTAEDQAAMDAGELFIGYGSDAVEDCYMTNLTWVKDGMKYNLCGQDLDLDQAGMVQMAKEVMSQK